MPRENKKMRVALVTQGFCPSRGGGETYTANLASQLVKEGHKVHIFTNIWEESRSLCFRRVPALRGLSLLSFAINSARQLRGEDFDIIQGFGETYYADICRLGGGCEKAWLLEAPVNAKNPIICFLRRLGRMFRLHNLMHLFIERKRYADGKCQRVIVPSEIVKRQLIRYYRIPETRISVIRSGVDLKRFHPDNKDKFRREIREKHKVGEEIVILFVSNNFQLKGLNFLMKALSLLKGKKQFKLFVVGGGKISKYKGLAKKLGLEKEVIFTRKVGETERYYGASDILVHPTLCDPFANVCMEALASGLAVITTKYNGASEIITDGKEGLVIDDPRQVDILTERIQWLFNEEKRREISIAARARAEEFSFQRNYQSVLQIYEEVRREKENEDN